MTISSKLKDPAWIADKYRRIGFWVLLISGSMYLALIPMRFFLNVTDVVNIPGDVDAFSAYGFLIMTTLGFCGIPAGLSFVLTARAMRKQDENKTKDQHYVRVALRMLYILFLSLVSLPLLIVVAVLLQF